MKTILAILLASAVFLPQTKPVTELSKRAAQLKLKMSKAEVLAVLGPATWAILPTDRGDWALEPHQILELRWANGNCNNVAVSFDRSGRVSGWDEGRAVCADKPYSYNPPDKVSCKQKDRAKACRA